MTRATSRAANRRFRPRPGRAPPIPKEEIEQDVEALLADYAQARKVIIALPISGPAPRCEALLRPYR